MPETEQNVQLAEARRLFIDVARRETPQFFEQLFSAVFPTFARLVEHGSAGWQPDWPLESLERLLDHDGELRRHLLAWARIFHVDDEAWIIAGALRTLARWQQHPEFLESLDPFGFYSNPLVDVGSLDVEETFRFEHAGWDPEFQAWSRFRQAISKAFAAQLAAYERQRRGVFVTKGATKARYRLSPQNLEWLALYQLGGLSPTEILNRSPELKGDQSTIAKGLAAAASLIQWNKLRKPGGGAKTRGPVQPKKGTSV